MIEPVAVARALRRVPRSFVEQPPDANREPVLHAHWAGMLRKPYRYIVAEMALNPPDPPPVSMGGQRTAPRFSRNWAGLVARPTGARRFGRVAGRWTVPGIEPSQPRNEPRRLCSIWVGFGGSGQAQASMPQMGSEHGYAPGTLAPMHRLWWQWWAPKMGLLSTIITNIDIAPGDDIMVCGERLSSVLMRFHLRASRPGRGTVFTSIELLGRVPCHGATAEWIVERPTQVFSGPKPEGELMLPPTLLPGERFAMRQCAARAGEGAAEHLPLRARPVATIETRQAPTRLHRALLPVTDRADPAGIGFTVR